MSSFVGAVVRVETRTCCSKPSKTNGCQTSWTVTALARIDWAIDLRRRGLVKDVSAEAPSCTRVSGTRRAGSTVVELVDGELFMAPDRGPRCARESLMS